MRAPEIWKTPRAVTIRPAHKFPRREQWTLTTRSTSESPPDKRICFMHNKTQNISTDKTSKYIVDIPPFHFLSHKKF